MQGINTLADFTHALILIVDDEPNVLSSLNRVLRHSFRVVTALDAHEALLLLEQYPVDAVIADSHMPGMDGPALLAQVRTRWPDMVCILLTGHLDIESAIRAINHGQINRYLAKPWDDDELVLTLHEALERQYLYRERERLLALTREQNMQLQDMNAVLEQRVQERTAELLSTAQALERANIDLKHAYVTATEVFSSLISLRLPPSRQTNRQVIALATGFARFQGLAADFIQDLAMAAALYNLGKLTWEDALIALPPVNLLPEQYRRYRMYPQVSEQLMIPLQPVHEAAVMVRHHQERWDGKGFPDQLVGYAIPVGARILKLVVDFVETQMGMVVSRKITQEDVIKNLPKYAGSLYDPELCTAFLRFLEYLELQELTGGLPVKWLRCSQLEPGMVIVKDLYTASGTLLLKKGTQLTGRLIDRLLDFEEREFTAQSFPVAVDPEDT